MNLFVALYSALLFFVLTPGIFVSLPKGKSKMVVAATHALIFAVVYHFTHKTVWRLSMRLDGFQNAPSTMPPMPNMPAMPPAMPTMTKKEGFAKKK